MREIRIVGRYIFNPVSDIEKYIGSVERQINSIRGCILNRWLRIVKINCIIKRKISMIAMYQFNPDSSIEKYLYPEDSRSVS